MTAWTTVSSVQDSEFIGERGESVEHVHDWLRNKYLSTMTRMNKAEWTLILVANGLKVRRLLRNSFCVEYISQLNFASALRKIKSKDSTEPDLPV